MKAPISTFLIWMALMPVGCAHHETKPPTARAASAVEAPRHQPVAESKEICPEREQVVATEARTLALSVEAPFTELVKGIGEDPTPITVSSTNHQFTLRPYSREFAQKLPALTTDGKVGTLAFFLEDDGSVTVRTFTLSAGGQTLGTDETTFRALSDTGFTCPSEGFGVLQRLCGEPLAPSKRVTLVMAPKAPAERALRVLAALDYACPDRERMVHLGEEWSHRTGETIEQSRMRFGFHSRYEGEQQERFQDILPPIWVKMNPWTNEPLEHPSRHFVHGPLGWPREKVPTSVAVPSDFPHQRPAPDGGVCEQDRCPSATLKRQAMDLVRAVEKNTSSGSWTTSTTELAHCDEAIPQTRTRRLVRDVQGKVRALFVQQERGLSDTNSAWYFDGKGALRLRFTSSRWPKSPNAAVHGSDSYVYFDGVHVRSSGNEEEYYGPGPQPAEEASWFPHITNQEQARRLFDATSECVQYRNWLAGAPEEVSFTLVPWLPRKGPTNEPGEVLASRVKRLPKSLSDAVQVLQDAHDEVTRGRWSEKKRIGCPRVLLATSQTWLATSILIDEAGRTRALGYFWIGVHGSWEENRRYYDADGNVRLIWAHTSDDPGEGHFFRSYDATGKPLATEALHVRSASEQSHPTYDFESEDLKDDPLATFSMRWRCNW